jgi:transcriptional regulator with PAS, ATPase and Fis domain
MSENIEKLKMLTEKLQIKDKELLENEQMLKNILENMPGSINLWVTDKDFNIKYVAGSNHRETNNDCEALQKSIFDFLDPEKDNLIIQAHKDAFLGVSSKFEHNFNQKDYIFSIKPLEDKFGKIVGAIGTQFNISKYIGMKNRLNTIVELLKECDSFNKLSCEKSDKIKNLLYNE